MAELRNAAIHGATGPTGKHLARMLRERGSAVRVISRGEERLRCRAFPDAGFEKRAADALRATPYERSIPATLDWLRNAESPPG